MKCSLNNKAPSAMNYIAVIAQSV